MVIITGKCVVHHLKLKTPMSCLLVYIPLGFSGIISEIEDNGFAKDPLMGNEVIPLENGKCLDRWQFPRNDLEEIETLGHGKMGRVFKANATGITNAKQTLVAVKEFDGKGEEHQAEFDLEFEMFAQLNHDNVVRLLGITTDKQPTFIITEYSEEVSFHLEELCCY